MDFLREQLNVWWLRPESALWDSIASHAVARCAMPEPSLDFGCGNGIYSFVTAGGRFDADYDWFVNANPETDRDMFDAVATDDLARWIVEPPARQFTHATDRKGNLLRQALGTGLYRCGGFLSDGNRGVPVLDESYASIFSNMLYWLESRERALREIHRMLRRGGTAVLWLIDESFRTTCESYQWKTLGSAFLRELNGGRAEHIKWTVSNEAIQALSQQLGFDIVSNDRFLSPWMLKFWDVGLRPLARPLIKMVGLLTPADRRALKAEWIDTCERLLRPLYETEVAPQPDGGCHLVVLRKR